MNNLHPASLFLMVLLSGNAFAGLQDYCDEIDLNPDLRSGNYRIYENPHSLDCNLTSSLPGLGRLKIVQKACEKVSDSLDKSLDKVLSKLDDELNNLDSKAQSEIDKYRDSDSYWDDYNNGSDVDFGGEDTPTNSTTASAFYAKGTYSNGVFTFVTDSGMTYQIPMSEQNYKNGYKDDVVKADIERAEQEWLEEQSGSSGSGTATGSNGGSSGWGGSGDGDYGGYFN